LDGDLSGCQGITAYADVIPLLCEPMDVRWVCRTMAGRFGPLSEIAVFHPASTSQPRQIVNLDIFKWPTISMVRSLAEESARIAIPTIKIDLTASLKNRALGSRLVEVHAATPLACRRLGILR